MTFPATPQRSADADVSANEIVSRRDPKTTVDSSVTQGNRLKTVAQVDPTSPVSQLEAKIADGFNQGMNLLAELRAGADRLEELLNKLRVGF